MSIEAQLCTFHLDGLLFGVPVDRVQEIIRFQNMTRVPLAPPAVSGLINLRGQVVTAIDLRTRLGLSKRAQDQLPINVVIQNADGAASLLVDEIGDVQAVDESAFEPSDSTLKEPLRTLVQGIYKLPDQLLLLLDVERALDVSTN